MCICSSHRKYLSPFFCCIVLYYVESCIFSIQIQICFLVYKYNFFYYLGTLDKDGLLLDSQPCSEGSNELGSVRPSLLLSIRLEVFLGLAHYFFLKLRMVLGVHVLLHVTARFFEKNLVAKQMGQMRQKWVKK